LINPGKYFFRSEKDIWEIPQENLVIQREAKLGSGAFADVYTAKLVGDAPIRQVYKGATHLSKFHDCEVAVKMLPAFASKAAKSELKKVKFLSKKSKMSTLEEKK
jgi:hypothetical protein